MTHTRTALTLVLAATMTTAVPHEGTAALAPLPIERCDLPGPYDYPHGEERIDLQPADFTTVIDNPYFPMRPGTVLVYRETDADETVHVRVRVTHRTRMVDGIRTRVVHDVARSRGEIIEDTFDWYAQDSGGTIWYFGEATKAYDDGDVSTAGSWEHGKNGAQAGVLVPAAPEAGCAYREEYREGVAEDRAVVLARRETLTTPTGRHRDVLHTANTTPLEPAILENKFYARGIGPVLEIDLARSVGSAVLVRVIRP